MKLLFDTQRIQASFLSSAGNNVQHDIEIRTNPVTFRTCRITHARLKEKDPGTEKLPPRPPEANNPGGMPFLSSATIKKYPSDSS
jgi:UDPglucose--hexose-1-phosphate uridylyltransferase